MELPTFADRYLYLKLGGKIGIETFGGRRWLNQDFYLSHEWRDIRSEVIIRDYGCDLADPDHPFGSSDRIYIHHINPLTIRDLRDHTDYLLDPEYLISCSFDTHNAIHYGDDSILRTYEFSRRQPNDTRLWR